MRLIQGLMLLLSALTGADAAVPTVTIPEPLRPWVDWVLYGEEERRCPLIYSDTGGRRCAWPSALRLELTAQGGNFEQLWHADAESWLTLPGERGQWPQAVMLDGIAVAVLERDNRPVLKAGPGDHRISGQLIWSAIPESLKVPAETALLSIAVNNAPLYNPAIEADGTVWLRQRAAAAADTQDYLEMQVARKLSDGVPVTLSTRLSLRVAGQARELQLGPVLPENFIPLNLRSPLPARLETDGRLRLQVKPGDWTVEIGAHYPGPVELLNRPAAAQPWPEQEVWVFEAASAVRVVTIAGADAIDPAQTSLPAEWRTLPAYLMMPETRWEMITRQRGASPTPDQLSLSRTLWLDFDGSGYTVQDRLQGKVSSASRLEAAPELRLGRVGLNGQDQFITRRTDSDSDGVELRQGAIHLSADSRLAAPVRGDLPAVGWRLSPTALSTTLNLPPGWRLLAARGADSVSTAWVYQWTLLDLFIVLITAVAFARLWGWLWGALALIGLTVIYHEPDAPRLLWLNLLAAIALLRVLPAGRLQTLARAYRYLSLLVLVVICLIFAVQQVRSGLYPQLATPAMAPPYLDASRLPAASPASEESLPRGDQALKSPSGPTGYGAPSPRLRLDYAADIKVQTGPGLPQWRWWQAELRWNGPVAADARLRLWLLPPWVSRLLAFLGVGLMLALLARVMEVPIPGRRALPVLAVCLLLPPAVRAEMPSPELLNELRSRLLQAPDCAPRCAALARLDIQAGAGELRLNLDLHAQADSALPLPLRAERIIPRRISLDGRDATLYRAADGILWLRLTAGLHRVEINASLPADLMTLQLPLPMAPGRVDLTLAGWSAEGVFEGLANGEQIQLNRQHRETTAVLEPGVLPVLVEVERELVLGIDWRVRSRVRRLSQADAAAMLAIPLLPGERVTTPAVQIRDGRAQINLAPQQAAVEWTSTLDRTERIALQAAETREFVEVWRLQAAPLWHIEANGIAVIHHHDPQGDWLPEWRPWPGETLTLTVSRPEGVNGKTVTIDQLNLHLQPGERISDTRLEFHIRASRGMDHTLLLPAGAELSELTINDRSQPLQLKDHRLTLPLTPGSQRVAVHWREPRGMGSYYQTPAVELGTDSVNANLLLSVPRDRWILFAGGPPLGPAVLFWGLLVVIALAAIALGRYAGTPLRAWQWFLLGLGLSQAEPLAAVAVVGWLVLLGSRARLPETIPAPSFNLLQTALVLLTLLALAALAMAIRQGLLGLPDMQISGNGSGAYQLRWYQDRSPALLPQAWTVSVPMLTYRLLMLAWALWLALALLNWLSWAWSCFSSGGLWRRLESGKAKS